MADLDEKRKNLEARFNHEKEVFESIGKLKTEIDEAKTEAERFKADLDFNKAAEIEYGKIPELEEKLKQAKEQ